METVDATCECRLTLAEIATMSDEHHRAAHSATMLDLPIDIVRLQLVREELHPDLVPFLFGTTLGTVLKHPLVFQVPCHPIMHAWANRNYDYKRTKLAEVEREKDWYTYVFLHERPYRARALASIASRIEDDKAFWELVGDVWIDSENVYEERQTWRKLFASPRPHRDYIMDEDERAFLAGLPESIRVYRGYQQYGTRKGLSWTLDQERAEWFARRFAHKGEARVVCGTVPRMLVIAVFTRRGESEVVVLPGWVRNCKDVKISSRTEG